jgi:hypothetical protein
MTPVQWIQILQGRFKQAIGQSPGAALEASSVNLHVARKSQNWEISESCHGKQYHIEPVECVLETKMGFRAVLNRHRPSRETDADTRDASSHLTFLGTEAKSSRTKYRDIPDVVRLQNANGAYEHQARQQCESDLSG